MSNKPRGENSSSKPQSKGKIETPIRQRDVKCFKCQGYGHISSQCPTRRNMIILDNGEVESKHSSNKEMLPLEGPSVMIQLMGDPRMLICLVMRC